MPAVLFFILFGLIVALIVGLLLFIGQKRTKDMEAAAQKLKLKFYARGSDRLSPFLANFDFFSRGKYKRITNLMMGKMAGREGSVSVAVFDYSFTVGLKEDTDTFCQSVLLVFAEGMQLPQFCLRPAHVLNKLGDAIGFKDINFPEHPEFSKKYQLISNQELLVRQVFHPEVIEFLEEENFCAEASGAYLMLYPAGDSVTHEGTIHIRNGQNYAESRFLQPEEIPLFLETGAMFLKLLQRD